MYVHTYMYIVILHLLYHGCGIWKCIVNKVKVTLSFHCVLAIKMGVVWVWSLVKQSQLTTLYMVLSLHKLFENLKLCVAMYVCIL